jgi:hypothetical protein
MKVKFTGKIQSLRPGFAAILIPWIAKNRNLYQKNSRLPGSDQEQKDRRDLICFSRLIEEFSLLQ